MTQVYNKPHTDRANDNICEALGLIWSGTVDIVYKYWAICD